MEESKLSFITNLVLKLGLKVPVVKQALTGIAKLAKLLDGKTTEIVGVLYGIVYILEKFGVLQEGASKALEPFALGAGGAFGFKRLQKILAYAKPVVAEINSISKEISTEGGGDVKK